ncbi:MAG TPA: AIR synthase-related protein, partial [Pyrinomonadaceae bacterium]|jgi:phosphoribosylformylglycinamidine synthase
MVGLVEDMRRIIQHGFKRDGDLIALLGTTGEDLSISQFASTIEGRTTEEMIERGSVPVLDLERERAVQEAALRAAESGLLRSAHDCSDGGLAVALAECCFSSLNRSAIGAQIELNEGLSVNASLFAESPSRIIISLDEAALGEMQEIATRCGSPLMLLGRTGGSNLLIQSGGETVIDLPVKELETTWRTSLSDRLQAN